MQHKNDQVSKLSLRNGPEDADHENLIPGIKRKKKTH